jgi:acyl-coenzyme A thioesterase PaaI-like protein
MKRFIKNVFAQNEYHCFGCSPYNEIGLQLKFCEVDDYVETEWMPAEQYEGYPNVIHGGILSTLIDEVAAWTLYIKARCSGVTSRMNVRYRKQAESNQEKFTIRGKLREQNRNLCYIDVQLFNANNEVCTEAEVVYFAFSLEKSIKECYYPQDYNSFFEE